MEQNNDQSLFGLSVDAQARSFLSETAKWGKFFAILGFIGSVILVLVGVIVATNYEEFEKMWHDEYPDETIFANSNSGQFPYSSQSPSGFNGAYLYGRIGYKW